MKKRILWFSIVFVLIFSMALAACAPAATDESAPAEEVPAEAEEAVEEAPAEESAEVEEVEVSEQEPAGPPIGGTLHFAQYGDPDTLDAHRTSLLVATNVLQFIGAALIYLDPDTNIVPWLAESWEVSEDGLVWTFYLREDVTFSNGDPLTANDFVFTYRRAIDPETASPGAAGNLGPTNMDSFIAVDDYTFQITLEEPFYPLLISLADPAYMMPFSQKAFEEMGADAWASAPVSCGPYTVKDWIRGDRVILERRPDYNWGPQIEGMNPGAWYIETIEVMTIPEYSTILAGLEAGEIDYSQIETRDVELLEGTGFIAMLEAMQQGPRPHFVFNNSKPPFDDIRVRKAFNLAFNRDAFIQVLVQGRGYPQYGPLTPSQIGYWEGVEGIGYGYDLEQAKALMEEAGFTYGDDGMLITPEGEPFELTVYTIPIEIWVKTTEIAAEQLKQLGVSATIQQDDPGVLIGQVLIPGDHQFSIMGTTGIEADLMYYMFHSSNIGSSNFFHNVDPELDAVLDKTRTETDPVARQEAVNQAQQMIIEKAIMVPLYVPINYYAINTRVKGYTYSTKLNALYLQDAYIEE